MNNTKKKDFYGNELDTGWYWISYNEEGDVFHPVKVYPKEGIHGILFIDGKPRSLNGFRSANFYKAELPKV